jgi:glycosyltransferase involved in cell wall biosynthesis
MKICFINADSEIPVLGHEGCSIHVRELANGFVEAGHSAFVLCSALGSGHTMPGNIPVHLIEPRGIDALAWAAMENDPVVQTQLLQRDLRSILFNEWLVSEGLPILERERPDFIYERHSLFNGGGWKLSRRLGIPLTIEVNAPICDEQAGYDMFPLIEAARRIEIDVLRHADAVVVVSAWLREWMAGKGVDPHRVRVIPNAVAGRLFERPASGDAVRAKHGLAGYPLIGYVGSFQSWHDVSGLVEAFAEVQREVPEARLLMVGSGQDQPAIQKVVQRIGLESKVVFAGKVPHEMIPEYMAAFDVAAAPFKKVWNYQYGSPLKLFEYMGAGKPTVAGGIGQVAEVLEHGRTGLLYPPQNVPEMARALLTLLKDRDLAARLGAAAHEKVMRCHTWRGVAEQVVGMAVELIRRGLATEPRQA